MGLKAWIAGRVITQALTKLHLEKVYANRITQAIKNIMNKKRSMKNEPVLIGGIATVCVALAASLGLDLSADELAITISTLVAVVTFLQRKYVSPTKK